MKKIPCYWLQNIQQPQIEPLNLTASYDPNLYPTYDNYEAIEVGRVKDIPKDYFGFMGVPVSFIKKYCPEQFEIESETNGSIHSRQSKCYIPGFKDKGGVLLINGRFVYTRLLIRRKDVK